MVIGCLPTEVNFADYLFGVLVQSSNASGTNTFTGGNGESGRVKNEYEQGFTPVNHHMPLDVLSGTGQEIVSASPEPGTAEIIPHSVNPEQPTPVLQPVANTPEVDPPLETGTIKTLSKAEAEPVMVEIPVQTVAKTIKVEAPVQTLAEPVKVKIPVQTVPEPEKVETAVQAVPEPVKVDTLVQTVPEPLNIETPVQTVPEPVKTPGQVIEEAIDNPGQVVHETMQTPGPALKTGFQLGFTPEHHPLPLDDLPSTSKETVTIAPIPGTAVITPTVNPEQPTPAIQPVNSAPEVDPPLGTGTIKIPSQSAAEPEKVEIPVQTVPEHVNVEIPVQAVPEPVKVETPVQAVTEPVKVETPVQTAAEHVKTPSQVIEEAVNNPGQVVHETKQTPGPALNTAYQLDLRPERHSLPLDDLPSTGKETVTTASQPNVAVITSQPANPEPTLVKQQVANAPMVDLHVETRAEQNPVQEVKQNGYQPGLIKVNQQLPLAVLPRTYQELEKIAPETGKAPLWAGQWQPVRENTARMPVTDKVYTRQGYVQETGWIEPRGGLDRDTMPRGYVIAQREVFFTGTINSYEPPSNARDGIAGERFEPGYHSQASLATAVLQPGAFNLTRGIEPHSVATRLSEVIRVHLGASGNGQTTLSLTLEPADLGKITIKLNYVMGNLTAKFVAASGYVKEMIDGTIPHLRELLAEHNIKLQETSTMVNGEQGRRNEEQGWQSRGGRGHNGGQDKEQYPAQQPEPRRAPRSKESELNYLI